MAENEPPHPEEIEPEMTTNDYGASGDSAVVIEEENRTVLLTNDETVIIEKQPRFSIPPKDRPRKPYAGMWGNTEIAFFGLAIMAALASILVYFFVVVPSNRELEEKRAETRRLETELLTARGKYGDMTNTETEVAKLVESVDSFESNYLPVAVTGQTSLYQRLNGLIVGYGLINTNGPTYAPLEIAEPNQADRSESESGREKFRSLFPGVYVTMTVEGPYQNLRRFIRDIETGNEFVVISSVELAPSDAASESGSGTTVQPNAPAQVQIDPQTGFPMQQAQQQVRPPTQRGRTYGERVALRLEMAAYFRRPNLSAAEPATDSPTP